MRLKIRFDGESEKFGKIFWELNKAVCVGPTRTDPAFIIFFFWAELPLEPAFFLGQIGLMPTPCLGLV